jgi:hypothetical protein
MSDQEFSFRLHNSRESRLKIYLEPWGELHIMEPDSRMQVDAKGPVGESLSHTLEIQTNEDSITIWGWSRSGISVHKI